MPSNATSRRPPPTANRDEILRALSLLGRSDAVRELRVLTEGRDGTISGYFDNPELLAAEGMKWSGRAPAVYVTLNELPREALARCPNEAETRAKATTSDGDISRRRWFPVDTDPSRLSRTSSTDEQHAASIVRARQIADWLAADLGWPSPVIADSGNGGHLLFRIDLENDDASRLLVERCLKALGARFDDGLIKIDQTVFNAARIWKLYGTAACKGANLPEWPHRLARLLDVPELLQVVSVEQIRALAALAPEEAKQAKGKKSASGATFDLGVWIGQHLPDADGPKPWEGGGQLWVLPTCPVNTEHNRGEAYVIQHANGAIAAGCHHNSCTWDWHDLRDRFEPDRPKAREKPPAPGDEDAPRRRKVGAGLTTGRNGASPEPDPAPWVPATFTAADLLAEELPDPRFVVDKLLPAGLAILAGKPKLGKSWLALGVAIAVAAGGKALGGSAVNAGEVLYLALEDNRRRLQSRLKQILGEEAAPARLALATEWRQLDDGGLSALRLWLTEHPGARLVIIDTLGRIRRGRRRDGDAFAEDYAVIASLKALADEFDVALVVVHHQRKAAGADAFDTISGTLGLTGAADTLLILKRDRGSADAVLHVTGRDVEEQELALAWDATGGTWSIVGDAEEARLSSARADILRVLRGAGEPLGPKAIADALGKKVGAVKVLLSAMLKDGQVRCTDGKYTPAGRERQSQCWNCRSQVATAEHGECARCHWIPCPACGACKKGCPGGGGVSLEEESLSLSHDENTPYLTDPAYLTYPAYPPYHQDPPPVSEVSSPDTAELTAPAPSPSTKAALSEQEVSEVSEVRHVEQNADWHTRREALLGRAEHRGYPEIAVGPLTVAGEEGWRWFTNHATVEQLAEAEATLERIPVLKGRFRQQERGEEKR